MKEQASLHVCLFICLKSGQNTLSCQVIIIYENKVWEMKDTVCFGMIEIDIMYSTLRTILKAWRIIRIQNPAGLIGANI